MIPPLSGILGEPPPYRNAIPQETAKKSSTPFDNDDICVMFDCSQDNTPTRKGKTMSQNERNQMQEQLDEIRKILATKELSQKDMAGYIAWAKRLAKILND